MKKNKKTIDINLRIHYYLICIFVRERYITREEVIASDIG